VLSSARAVEGGFEVELDPARWWIDGHRLGGTALVPATGWIELAAEAVAARVGGLPLEVRELVLLQPLLIPDGERRALKVVISGDASKLKLTVRGDSGELVMAEGGAASSVAGTQRDLAAIRARCPDERPGAVELRFAELAYGPPWDNVRRVWYGAEEALAELALPSAHAAQAEELLVHPALLDRASTILAGVAAKDDPLPYLPFSVGRLRVFAPLPAAVWVHARRIPAKNPRRKTLRFDLELCDGDGRLRVEVSDFSMAAVDPARFAR
jgi:hypothetical protein